ncbi:hypothetical protein ILT44_26965 [Microvirga sp. BT689]|uniref:hypothetical protein n=1 Tax=Microvirga arvi TaxID=2778731 RepID=UPI00194F832A|nr:hypothetical protein [Microvirga arvi]MBM6583846.1 hypothetical protein [Microvirga arvi]
MSKSNRLKPDPTSRNVLKELSQKGILSREKVGIRNIMRAETRAFEPVGYSHYWFRDAWERLPNFHPNAPQVTAWVDYNEQRAEITATYGDQGWYGTPYDLSSIFPANELADKLLRQPSTKPGRGMNVGVSCYGDAVLVTDIRMHWIFSNWKADAEEIELFDAMLSTPRQILTSGYRPVIFFHEEPNHVDLVALKMRWF